MMITSVSGSTKSNFISIYSNNNSKQLLAMERVLFPQLAPEARLEAIKKTAKSSEELTFTRHLSDAEIDAESRRLAKLVNDLTEIEDEKSAAAKEYGDKIKSIKELMKDSSKTISKGEKEVTEKVYKFIDYDTQEVLFYDSYGNIVKVRKAMMDELQMDMFGNGQIDGQQKAIECAQEENEPEDAEFTEVSEEDADGLEPEGDPEEIEGTGDDDEDNEEEDDRPYPYNQD